MRLTFLDKKHLVYDIAELMMVRLVSDQIARRLWVEFLFEIKTPVSRTVNQIKECVKGEICESGYE